MRARGTVALARGNLPEAIRNFEEAGKLTTSSSRLQALSELALIYDLAGDTEAAISAFDAYLETPWAMRIFGDHIKRAYFLERLGQLYDEQGNLEKAVLYNARFVELWADADADLQPRVKAAQARLDEIVRERG